MPLSGRVSRRSLLIGGGAAVGGVLLGRRYLVEPGDTTPPAPLRNADPTAGSWGELLSMDGIAPVHASLLPSGRVLITGATDRAYTAGGVVNFAFDPTAPGSIGPVDRMDLPMRGDGDSLFCAGHSLLADGRSLYVGGQRKPPESGLEYALLFDSRSGDGGVWSPVDQRMIGGPAWYPTATRLSDARMLVISGFSDWGETENRTIQVYDPQSDAEPWSLLVPHRDVPDVSPTGADYTHSFLLPRPVLVAGRAHQVAMLGQSGRVYLFDYTGRPDGDRFVSRPNGRRPAAGGRRPAAGASSALLPDGRILVIGAGTEDGTGNVELASRAHIYDPQRDRWRTIDTGIARAHPVAVLLPDARVLVVNGDGGNPGDPRRAQIIDPVTEAIITDAPWPDRGQRGYHNTALLVPDGRVMTGSGESELRRHSRGPRERPDVRFYSPPYLSILADGDRPAIAAASSQMAYSMPYQIGFEHGPIHRVTLMGLGSMTHSFDQNQRCVVLFDGEASGDELTIGGPSDRHAAPPGPYMLFVLRRVQVGRRGILVPSVGRMIAVT
jgi:galactose oxidase